MMVLQKLTRKWRKSPRESHYDENNNFSLPTRDDFRPIDSQEQEELVRSLEKVQTQQSLLWRGVFSGLLLCYVAFLVYSIYQQTYYPWDLRYHAYFMYKVDAWTIIAADWAAILMCLMTITGLLHESKYHRRWLWSSCCIGMIVAVFWLHHMLRIERHDLWWEITTISGICAGSWVVCGDYSITWCYTERRNDNRYTRDMLGFSDFIDDLELMDPPLSGVSFTWIKGDNQEISSRFDMFLLSTKW